jgi:hypothetical protein
MTEQHAAQAPALREQHQQIFNCQSSIFNIFWSAYPPASPVRRNLHMLESGTVNSDGGQAAASFKD